VPVHNVHPNKHPTVSAPDLLQGTGLLVDVEISVPGALAKVIHDAGRNVPMAQLGGALIDTGASCCCVEEPVLLALGLKPVGQVNVASPNGNRLQNIYFTRLSFPGTPIPPLEIQVVGGQLNQEKTISLIGRDFPRQCVLIYNGPMGCYTISF